MQLDISSTGFVVQVLTSSLEARQGGRPDPGQKPGLILDRMDDISPRVSRFEFSHATGMLGRLKLSVDNFDNYFFDSPAWLHGSLLRYWWGYPGRIQGPRYAFIDSIRGFNRLEISCLEEVALSNEESSRLWANTTRAEIAATLVKEGALPGVKRIAVRDLEPVDPRQFLAAVRSRVGNAIVSYFGEPVAEARRDYQQATETAWQFLYRLAGETGSEFFVEDDVLHFHPKDVNQTPIRKYEWFGGSGDFLDFELEEWRASGRLGSVRVVSRDPLERERPIEAIGSNATTERYTSGKQGMVAQETALKKGGRGTLLLLGKTIIPSAKTDPAAVKNLADATFRRLEDAEIWASARVIGDPALRAARLVELTGVSTALSGNYYIREITHSIDSSGYVCNMKLTRNAVKALPTSAPPELDSKNAKDSSIHARVGQDRVNGRLQVPGK